MRLAVIGTGIAGLTAAHLLHPLHDLTLFEAADWIGGHSHTVEVDDDAGSLAIDTGFIVCNDRTYPNFLKLLSRIGVSPQTSDMSFSVRCERTGLEYSGGSWNGLFAQRRNFVRPSFWQMLRDIVRFNREAPALLNAAGAGPTLGEYLAAGRYGEWFKDLYLLPMAAAIWSGTPRQMARFPARSLVRFFQNHGLLSVYDRPQWLTIPGGSRNYVAKLTAPFRDQIRLKTPVLSLRRDDGQVVVRTASGEERFDHAIVAVHSDQALRMLADPSSAERDTLTAITYQPNDVVLHRGTAMLPRSRRAWSSWNYHALADESSKSTVTYWMNRLQRLPSATEYCVTLNRTNDIDPADVLGRYDYDHPVFTPTAVAAQKRWAEINGHRGVSFCGAYWGYGFHEDGVVSGLRVAEALGARW